MSKRAKVILIIILLLALGLAGVFGVQWWQKKMKMIELGLAEKTFPFRAYSEEELAKMYPQIPYANIPTRTTPEQTYAKFRQALKENNLEMALEQLSKESERYEENVEIITEAYKKGRFGEIYKKYPEEILKSDMYESIAEYYYLERVGENEVRQSINFIKDSNGDWKLDSL
jgi:flagellar basal body-associated protein FliL